MVTIARCWIGVVFVATIAGAAAQPPVVASPSVEVGPIAADPYEHQWFDRVPPWRREAVAHVDIDATGLGEAQRDVSGDPEPCASFKPGERDVRDFVEHGKKISQRDFMHETTWSACHATGRVRFRSGRDAPWMIQRYGAGYLVIGGRRHYLDCERCRFVGAATK